MSDSHWGQSENLDWKDLAEAKKDNQMSKVIECKIIPPID